MASSVFFKFKSQKEPTRVEFDGTGISLFELKREIITRSDLGDGTDFDLFIYTDDNSEEYDDDATIVPRSTTVVASRQPALKPGAGRAARYISGKMPVSAKNGGRREQFSKTAASKPKSNAMSQMNSAMTEQEKVAAMFAAQSEQWSAQQEEMSQQAPVFKTGPKRPANVPDHDPPAGYICYRCGSKGHWIQLCPTNDNPEFDNRPRVKRTTGIPRSFLQKVDKSVVLAQTDGDDTKRPSGIMVNAEGDFVIAEPDKASWEQFQAKTKSFSAIKETEVEIKEVQERGLECLIDKKMLIEPMKTPCCKKAFCNDCITNALIESDFVCPFCQTEGVLIDDLTPDDEKAKQIQDYLKNRESTQASLPASPKIETEGTPSKETPNKNQEDNKSTPNEAVKGNPTETTSKINSPIHVQASIKSPPKGPKSESQDANQLVPSQATDGTASTGNSPKKRLADDFLQNPRIPKGPKAMQNQQAVNSACHMPDGMGINSMMLNGMGMMPHVPNMLGMPNMNMNMNLNMNMNMGMPMIGMPMMGIPGFGGMNMNGAGFGGMNGAGFGGMNGGGGWSMNSLNGGMSSMNSMHGVHGTNDMNSINGVHSMHGMNMQGPSVVGGPMGHGMGAMNGFSNGSAFAQQINGSDDAYFRKPVNTHRHQNKQWRVRPSDYREL